MKLPISTKFHKIQQILLHDDLRTSAESARHTSETGRSTCSGISCGSGRLGRHRSERSECARPTGVADTGARGSRLKSTGAVSKQLVYQALPAKWSRQTCYCA